jgi:hypothetical protein
MKMPRGIGTTLCDSAKPILEAALLRVGAAHHRQGQALHNPFQDGIAGDRVEKAASS